MKEILNRNILLRQGINHSDSVCLRHDPKHTVTEYIVLSFTSTIVAIQVAKLLKYMLSHTGDLCSRLDTLDDINDKNCPFPQNASLLFDSNHFSLKYFYLTL